MDHPKLFMLLLGSTPRGRHTEQHDVFFSIGHVLRDLVPDIAEFWPEAEGDIHIDAWREVTCVDNYSIQVIQKNSVPMSSNEHKIFFLNLGGYKQNEFEEFHYKMLSVAVNKSIAVQQAKQTAFYKHTGFKGAESHIDDKYGIDVDDVYQVEDILPGILKDKYQIWVRPAEKPVNDQVHLGYFQLHKI